tara:strand:- start:126 stop:593 length:468 start_codon:yes stop_codon:yes gene_type:complete
MHKIVVVISLILLTNCSRNAVINTHGVPFLEIKQKSLIVEKSNKNDVIKLIGPPSTKATFDNSVWIYIERTRTRGKLLKFGQNVTSKNNVLALEFDKYGILVKKDFYDKENINKIAFVEGTTTVVTKETSFVYNFLSSVRQKINNPLKKKHRNVN